MNIALWVVQALLAALFLFAGGMKFVMSIEEMTKQVPLPGWFLHFIGVVEVLGALGLILPWLTRIRPGPDAAGRRRAGDHHDRCDHDHLDDRSDRVRIDPAGDWATLCFHSIRPLAAYAAALILGRWSVRTGEIVNTTKTAAISGSAAPKRGRIVVPDHHR